METTFQDLMNDYFNQMPNLTISFGNHSKTNTYIKKTSEYLLISSFSKIYVLLEGDSMANIFDTFVSCEKYSLFFDKEDFSNEDDFIIFYEIESKHSVYINPEFISKQKISYIRQDLEVIYSSMTKIVNEYNKFGINFLTSQYSWASIYVQNGYHGKELHISHSGGFSIYYIELDSWEIDGTINKDTLRIFKRFLKYK